MYVFAHLGSATPVAQKCAKGALYGDAPAYLPGMGKPAASTSSWVPLAVAGALGLGVIWWLARSTTPVLAENPSDRIDPDELRRGTDHEMEHTSSRKVARRIALDHLAEDPRYYKKLDEVEDAGFGALFAPNLNQSFTVQFRVPVSARLNHSPFAILTDAIQWGLSTGKEFDVSNESGAIVWAWEMRDSRSMADWAENPSLQPGDRVCAAISLHHTGVTVSRGDCGTVIAVQKGRTYRTKTGFGSERHKTGDRVQIRWDRGAAGWHDANVLEPMRENPKPKLVNFEIATRDGGSETRRGYVEGDYATHKGQYFWDFTHLPTGMLLNTYPVHETKASALAHLHELATVGPPEHVMRLLERYPGWGGSGKEKPG